MNVIVNTFLCKIKWIKGDDLDVLYGDLNRKFF